MGIPNTVLLTETDRASMNDGIRAFMLQGKDAPRLADYFGVSVRTVQRWFIADDNDAQTRPLLPSTPPDRNPAQVTIPLDNGSVQRIRVFQMFDAGNLKGTGSGNELKGAGPLQNMRLKVLLGAALGVAGGLYRPNPIFGGEPRSETVRRNNLDEALHYLNSVYIGDVSHGYFISRAWITMAIEPHLTSGWNATIVYNELEPGDNSNGTDKEDG